MRYTLVASLCLLILTPSCTKLVEIPPPANSITTEESFSDSASATSAVAGLYSMLINNSGNISFASGALTVYMGISADELVPFTLSEETEQIYSNSVQSDNGNVYVSGWSQPFSFIYQANAALEALNASETINEAVKKRLVGEVKVIRALCYFYLINLFGDVPFVTSSDWSTTKIATRKPVPTIYDQLVLDLQDARELLPDDFSYYNDERIRVNKWAATSLLARIHLYMGEWQSAELNATSVIDKSSLFSLTANLTDVFSPNSSESILQFKQNNTFYPGNATSEGLQFIPFDHTTNPIFYINPLLLDAFESGDLRKNFWIDSTNYLDSTYYYPFKYRTGPAQIVINGDYSEYYTALRLAEQYLIRAEARAMQTNLIGAIDDINIIRNRAGLSDTTALDVESMLNIIAHERQIELFAEWGHRWFDLRRTKKIDAVMNIVTPSKGQNTTWDSYKELFPIPFAELQLDPNLTQNTGYN